MTCIKCKTELPAGALYCHLCGKKQSATKLRRVRHGNGSGTVRKLSGKRRKPWEAYTPAFWNGVEYERIYLGTFETEQLAREAIRKVSPRSLKETYSYTVEDVYEAWKGPHFATIGPKGAEGYEISWRYMESMKGRKMRDVSTYDLQGVIDSAVAAGKSRSLCEKIKQLQSQLCKWAIDNDVLPRNMAERVKLPKAVEREKRIFTDDEIASIELLAASKEFGRISKIVMVLIYSGMRISELTTMKMQDVHLHEGYMIGGVKTEQGKNRIIPIHKKIRSIVAEWVSAKHPIDFESPVNYLIPSKNGTPLQTRNVRRDFTALMLHLGINGNITLHSCRHTYATKHARVDTRPEVLSRLMGHTDYDITKIYTHTDITELVAANDKIV